MNINNNKQDDVVDAVITIKFVIKKIISTDALEKTNTSFEDIVKMFLEEEELCELVNDSKIEIINIEKRINKEE